MDEWPLVTVNILSYNRKDELKNTLTKVFEQDYKNIEVIVVDNASSDGSVQMIRTEFPEVQIIPLKSNEGASGLNHGFQKSKGDYVLILDDDSFPRNGALAESIRKFQIDAKIALVAFHIYNSALNFFENLSNKEGVYTEFIGCGAIIKTEILQKVGFYDELYFLYHNEIDLSIRIIEAGYKIEFLENFIVEHRYSSLKRKDGEDFIYSESKFYYNLIGRGIFLLKYFSFKNIIFSGFRLLIGRLLIAFKYRWLKIYIKAIFNLLSNFSRILRSRNPVSIETQRLYNYGKINFIDPTFL